MEPSTNQRLSTTRLTEDALALLTMIGSPFVSKCTRPIQDPPQHTKQTYIKDKPETKFCCSCQASQGPDETDNGPPCHALHHTRKAPQSMDNFRYLFLSPRWQHARILVEPVDQVAVLVRPVRFCLLDQITLTMQSTDTALRQGLAAYGRIVPRTHLRIVAGRYCATPRRSTLQVRLCLTLPCCMVGGWGRSLPSALGTNLA